MNATEISRPGAVARAVGAFCALALSGLAEPMAGAGQVETMMSFQARLTDDNGEALPDGQYKLDFFIYDAEAEGTLIGALLNIDVLLSGSNGVVSCPIGPVEESWFDDAPRFLGLTIDDDDDDPAGQELAPRIRLTAVPFAMRAFNLPATANLTAQSATLAGSLVVEGLINVNSPQSATDQMNLRGFLRLQGYETGLRLEDYNDGLPGSFWTIQTPDGLAGDLGLMHSTSAVSHPYIQFTTDGRIGINNPQSMNDQVNLRGFLRVQGADAGIRLEDYNDGAPRNFWTIQTPEGLAGDLGITHSTSAATHPYVQFLTDGRIGINNPQSLTSQVNLRGPLSVQGLSAIIRLEDYNDGAPGSFWSIHTPEGLSGDLGLTHSTSAGDHQYIQFTTDGRIGINNPQSMTDQVTLRGSLRVAGLDSGIRIEDYNDGVAGDFWTIHTPDGLAGDMGITHSSSPANPYVQFMTDGRVGINHPQSMSDQLNLRGSLSVQGPSSIIRLEDYNDGVPGSFWTIQTPDGLGGDLGLTHSTSAGDHQYIQFATDGRIGINSPQSMADQVNLRGFLRVQGSEAGLRLEDYNDGAPGDFWTIHTPDGLDGDLGLAHSSSTADHPSVRVTTDGRVGINNPQSMADELNVRGFLRVQGLDAGIRLEDYDDGDPGDYWTIQTPSRLGGDLGITHSANLSGQPYLQFTTEGRIGINNPQSLADQVSLRGSLSVQGLDPSLKFEDYNDGAAGTHWRMETRQGGDLQIAHSTVPFTAANMVFTSDGRIGIGTSSPDSEARLDVNGKTRTKVLTITGGSDLAEPFAVSESWDHSAIQAGMVMAIDPDHPGQVMLAREPYDRKVAGVISGANGLAPGMVMKAEGTPLADGEHNVALTGRVWCWCDASAEGGGGPIEPGDMLTTSFTPGHAMSVTDFGRAHGAVIGKAMTRLDDGKGLVLVLVNLQ